MLPAAFQYWEAFTAVHQMHSKWLDVGMHLAAFHLQSSRYDSMKPPAFGDNPHLTSLERERERLYEPTREEIEQQIDETLEKEKEAEQQTLASRFSRWRFPRRKRKKNKIPATNNNNADGPVKGDTNNEQKRDRKSKHHGHQRVTRDENFESRIKDTRKSINAPVRAMPKKKHKSVPGHRRVVSTMSCVTAADRNADTDAMDKRPLFLQEAAHLLSLLSAVAFSTLRNDLEHTESPLITFTPGAPFPCVDPDGVTADVRDDWGVMSDYLWFPTLRFMFGLSRNETSRAIYNAARPFRVIGGISDAEVALLQAARGPQAKVCHRIDYFVFFNGFSP